MKNVKLPALYTKHVNYQIRLISLPGDSGKAKKKKKGFFETLRLKRSDHDEEISPSQSPNDRDKKGFTNKLKNLFKIKRKTSPKPSRKHASESDESESEDLGSNSEELKDH